MEYQWGSVPGGNRKERRGKRAELPEEVAKVKTNHLIKID